MSDIMDAFIVGILLGTMVSGMVLYLMEGDRFYFYFRRKIKTKNKTIKELELIIEELKQSKIDDGIKDIEIACIEKDICNREFNELNDKFNSETSYIKELPMKEYIERLNKRSWFNKLFNKLFNK